MDSLSMKNAVVATIRRKRRLLFFIIEAWRRNRRRRKNRRFYMSFAHFGRSNSIFHTFLRYKSEAMMGNGREFQGFIHMSCSVYLRLLNLVQGQLVGINRHAFPVSSEERLVVTLRFLAHGLSFVALSAEFLLGCSTVGQIVDRTTTVLYVILRPIVLPVPNAEVWQTTEEGFRRRWNFPKCSGAIDGKHVEIRAPGHSGTTYFNYKKYFSIVLLAAADHDYKFIYVNAGAHGMNGDASIWNRCALRTMVENKTHGFPRGESVLPGSQILVPFVMVADEAFGGTPNILRPFARRGHLPIRERVFNYRLSRARRIIENAFGILTAKYAIFQRPITCSLALTKRIVMACVCLHNFCRLGDTADCPPEERYIYPGLVDTEVDGGVVPGEWRNVYSLPSYRSRGAATRLTHRDVRDSFADYFLSSAGGVPRQYRFLSQGRI